MSQLAIRVLRVENRLYLAQEKRRATLIKEVQDLTRSEQRELWLSVRGKLAAENLSPALPENWPDLSRKEMMAFDQVDAEFREALSPEKLFNLVERELAIGNDCLSQFYEDEEDSEDEEWEED